MGKLKLLMKSIVFSTRSRRRFFTFVIVFSILSGATIILLSYFDNFSREGLLDQRGVVVKTTDFDQVDLATAESDFGVSDGGTRLGAEKVIYFKYVNFGTSLRIFSIHPSYPWAFDDIQPKNLEAGKFPTQDAEVLVSSEILIQLDDSQSGINIFTNPTLGTRFKLGTGVDSPFDLKVSGIFTKPTDSRVYSDSREWLLITENAFEDLVSTQYLDFNDNQIYVYSISIIASGDPFSDSTYKNVDDLGAEYQNLVNNDPDYSAIEYKSSLDKNSLRTQAILGLGFGLFGTLLVSTLYSYLITRFRRREVAVLKAMGYGKWDVRIVILTEILVVAITGFIIGLLAIQAYLWNPFGRQGSYFYVILFSPTTVLAFLSVVVSSIPGFFMITMRILSVRPIEIFRQK